MQKAKQHDTRRLYFTEHVAKAMNKVLDYPLIVVEAPMGYGKTTAVREYLNNSGVDVLWLRVYDSNAVAFWNGFCRQLGEVDDIRSDSLIRLGFPDDGISRQEALNIIEGMKFTGRTVLVIDDYHLVDSAAVDSFIEFLIQNRISNFNIVLTARYIKLQNMDELKLKSYLLHITKENFELDSNDIKIYYKLCGINLKDSDANRLYTMTEGWISALYLLMLNYLEEGNFEMSGNIYKLVEKTVYMPFSNEIKDFLQTICIFESFSLELAIHMSQNDNANSLLTEVTSKNALIKYDERTKTYHIHNIFTKFLKDLFEVRNDDYKKEMYKNAAHWYLKAGDYHACMHYFYLSDDFDSLLSVVEMDKGHSFHNEHKKILNQYFRDCLAEIKQQHPIALLVYALCLFAFNENEMFEKVCGEFIDALECCRKLDLESRNELMGEFELLLSFTKYNDILKMREHIKKAIFLLEHPAKFIDTMTSWTFGSPSVLYMFHREVGRMDNEVCNLTEAMLFYNQLTQGHGAGGEYVMEAEAFYNRGDFENTEIAIHKAFYQANRYEQGDIAIYAKFLQARLAFVRGEYSTILCILQEMHAEVVQKKWYNLMHTIELCDVFIYAGLRRSEKIPLWIAEGDFDSSRLYYPAKAFMNIVYGRVLLINGEYYKLLGIAGQLIDTASVYPNLLGQIYTYIYLAASNLQIFRQEEARTALKQALDLALPDRLYMPFVENGDTISALLWEFYKQEDYCEDIKRILKLYDTYHIATEQMITGLVTDEKPKLSEREQEIAQLAAKGFTNKVIGERLFISENTVKMALKSVFSKLSINNRALLKQYFTKM